MTPRWRFLLLALPFLGAARAQEPSGSEQRLPSGKRQSDEILKEEHRKSVADAGELISLARDLEQELEKNDYHVLSIAALKKTEQIEKLARRIRSRMQRY